MRSLIILLACILMGCAGAQQPSVAKSPGPNEILAAKLMLVEHPIIGRMHCEHDKNGWEKKADNLYSIVLMCGNVKGEQAILLVFFDKKHKKFFLRPLKLKLMRPSGDNVNNGHRRRDRLDRRI